MAALRLLGFVGRVLRPHTVLMVGFVVVQNLVGIVSVCYIICTQIFIFYAFGLKTPIYAPKLFFGN